MPDDSGGHSGTMSDDVTARRPAPAQMRPLLLPADVDWTSPIATEPLYLALDRARDRIPGNDCIDFLGKS